MKIRASRRSVIKGGLALMGGTLFFPSLASSEKIAASNSSIDRDNKVVYMWSGALKPTSIRINVCMQRSGPIRLTIQDSAGKEIILPAFEMTDDDDEPDNNFNIATFDIEGLTPDSQYSYWVVANGVRDSKTGQFKTPAYGAFSFKVAFGNCCQTGSESELFLDILKKDPLMFIHTGDFHYENIQENEPKLFRDAYKKVMASATQSELYLNTPVAYMWDDHDYGGDNTNETSPSAAAAQAMYRHCVPHHELEKESGAIYHSFTIGRVKFVMTDNRSHRDPITKPDNVEKTMLGAEQKTWLKQELLTGKYENILTVWVNSVPWISSRDIDTWAGFSNERREISNFIEQNEIRNIAMIGGDAHILAIDDGRHNQFGDKETSLFPVIHAGPLDGYPTYRGGPYALLAAQRSGHYGMMEVKDSGNLLEVIWTGFHFDTSEENLSRVGNNVLKYSFVMNEPANIVVDNAHQVHLPIITNGQ